MGQIVVFALLSAVYPTLIAVSTVMLLLPRPKSLMLGFWCGAMITSVTCGLIFVFALDGSSTVKTARHGVRPALDLAIAALLVLAALALAKGEGRGPHLRERYRARHPRDEARPPRWQQKLRDGNPWHAFVVGILLSFPGVWYLAALDRLDKLDYSTLATIVVVVGFCLFQLILIELPMIAFWIWPTETPMAIDRAKSWASAHGRHLAVRALSVIAALLAVVGTVGLFT